MGALQNQKQRRLGCREFNIVSCHDDRVSACGETLQGDDELLFSGIVQTPCGLIKQYERRLGGKYDGERQRQALAFGQIAWVR